MTTIRCTKTLLDELGLKSKEFPSQKPEDALLGDWYCNLLRFDRRKVLLFTNADTLYSFWVLGIKKADLKDFGTLFSTHLAQNLAYEGFSSSMISQIAGAKEVCIGKTLSRSVLGSMNDFVYQSEYMIARGGGVQAANILEVNKQLNRTPMSAIGMNFAIEKMTERLYEKSSRLHSV